MTTSASYILERNRSKKHLRHYGLATWSCFREPPATHPVRTSSAAADSSTYLSLEEVLSLACQAGGTEGHGFKFIQLPISVGMPEAWSKGDWQPLGGRRVSLLQCAAELGIRVVGSGPLMEAGLISAAVDSALDGVPAVAQVAGVAPRLLQLARGAPGVTCTLVGHKQPAHVSANTALSRVAPLTAGQFEDAMANIAQGIRRM